MKKLILTSVTAVAVVLATSCENNDSNKNLPTAAEFKSMQTAALANITQHFTFDATAGFSTVSSHGVSIYIPAHSITKNGLQVTGNVNLDFIEIFDGGTMAVTGKPTRGVTPDGKLQMLLSGGEFFLNATQDGEQLELSGAVQLIVPAQITGGQNPEMTLWTGVETDTITEGDTAFVWDQIGDQPQGGGIIPIGAENVYAFTFYNFGWTNVDCFYSDPRPKTTLLADVPSGYDFENSMVYLSYDGQGHSLARLDTYTAEGLFSEHYGQIPIGLECHAIFVTVENGNYRYGIKPVVIAENSTITFSMNETVIGTKDQLIAAINAVQN